MLHDELQQTMKRLVDVNTKNKNLIENSLEMIEFNMNFIQSTRMSPGNNNYDKMRQPQEAELMPALGRGLLTQSSDRQRSRKLF